MKTKLFTLLLAVAASVGTMLAEKVQIGDLYYNLDATNQTAEVTSQNSGNYYSGDIVIPSSVTYNSMTYSVTSIGEWAFASCTGLTSVTIGNSVTSIGERAFSVCSGLTSVTIGNSVTSIGEEAFYGCSSLTSPVYNTHVFAYMPSSYSGAYTIPNGIESIAGSAFSGCRYLTSVTIPNSVTSIGDYAFFFCYGLTSVTIPSSVTSIGDYAFKGCSGLTSPIYNAHVFAYMPSSYSGAYTIPNGIEIIAGSAFSSCSYLTSVTIPNSVTSIGRDAFWDCSGLTSVTIPSSVTSIGSSAFRNCSSLTSITIPNSVTSIGNDAFRGCSSLTSPVYNTHVFAYMPSSYSGAYTIPNGIEIIAGSAFRFCNGLTSVTIPNSVTSIGDCAFDGCSGLTSVTIPNNVTSIGEDAFRDCSSLTSVTWNAKNCSSSGHFGRQVTSFTFGEDVEVIPPSACSGMTNLTSITIPSNVTSIGDGAFSGCRGLTSPVYNTHVFAFMPTSYSGAYTIPDGIESIAGSAFSGCRYLTSVTIPNSVTSIGGNAFYRCNGLDTVTCNTQIPAVMGFEVFPMKNIKIYVPCGTLETYQTAEGWSEYASQIKYSPLPYTIAIQAENGNVITTDVTTLTVCDPSVICTATANYGYHFTQWLDGNTDNPRTIELTQDTTFTAEFAKNTYTISTTSANPEWGTTAGDTAALYLDEVEISAIPNYGYHFVRWNDYNTSNPRIVSVTEDKTYTATFAKNVYSITKNSEHGSISGNSSAEYLDFVTLTVTPDYGYHFTQWSDGNTDNPRTIVLTQDTTFTAEFTKNTYTISTTSVNPEWGTTIGDTTALYMGEVEISAIPNYGYHFVRWNDYNTSNPRTVSVNEDKTYTATFAKNVYSITKNAEHGTISGNSSAEYLDEVTLSVSSDYGYHFVQWSDGLKDNPRIFQITSDTTFTAEFAPDRVGTCGKDLALVWSYDPNSKVLTIGNAGSFTENMQFGVEAPNEMEELVIGNSVTAIGANAFAGISSLKKVTIGESVKTIGEQAFYNCVNLETIFNYRPTPTNAYSTAFDGVDKFECKLYVLTGSINMYKNASVWRDFYYTYAIGAEGTTVTTNDVTVEPQDNAVTLTWPTNNNAATYTIEITKDSMVFCTLIFNANGQLTGIAYALDREGTYHAPAAIMTANGLQFTVTGLSSNTLYGYSLTTKDAANQVLATYSGDFTTTGEGVTTEIDNTSSLLYDGTEGTRKIIRNGQIYILRGDKTYTPTGQEVK